MAIILKSQISSLSELPWLYLSAKEASGYVDRFVIVEYGQSHMGENRIRLPEKPIQDLIDEFDFAEYFFVEKLAGITPAKDLSQAHENETLIRNGFTSIIKVRPWDVIISVDADEVIYRQVFSEIRKKLRFRLFPFRLTLYQTIYSPYIHWTNKDFVAPVIWPGFLKVIGGTFRNWRYVGFPKKGHSGVHFTWSLTIEEMIAKLSTYSHTLEYGKFASRELLSEAVSIPQYIFEPGVLFEVERLNIDSEILPIGFGEILELISDEVLER